jgi:hypothetical protein
MPKIQWMNLPPALRQHLFDRLAERQITPEDPACVEENSIVLSSRLGKIKTLTTMMEQDIHLSDLPELRDRSGGVVGKFHRPIINQQD